MTDHVTCHCGQTVEIDADEPTRELTCPRCRAALPVPAGRDPTLPLDGPHLKVIKGPSLVGWHFPLDSPEVLFIGKRRGSHILLPGSHVSRRHCSLHNHGGVWELRDEGSLNGTYVNGKRVDSYILTHGDLLRVGDFHLATVLPAPQDEN
jgi:hypothetical protein